MKNKNGIFGSLIVLGALAMCSCDKDTKIGPQPEPTPTPEPGTDVRVLTTTSNRSSDLTETWIDFSDKDNMSPTCITLVPEEEYQTMDGFGVAITGATCYNLLQMKPEDRHNFLQQTFSPVDGYGFSYCRISIGCSDFSLSDYTCCDTPGIENFALTSEEKDYIIPVLKEILAINPSLKIMGTPWTPPRWMKCDNINDRNPWNQWTSGSLNPDRYGDYAQYFVRWIQAFKARGIDIYSVTPQNEPLNRGNSASCYMPWQEERDFVKTALGPAFEAAGIHTLIYAFDHNYNYDNIADQKSYPTNIYNDHDAGKYLAGAAFHDYGGNKEELVVVHNATPAKDLVFSETSIGEWNNGRDLAARLNADMENVTLGTVNRWCRGVIVWNLMLDEDKGPYRPGGCSTCYGAVDINKDYTTMTRNSHYYIIAHMSSVVKPDAVRIGTKGYTANGLTYSAFRNTNGSYALVLSNSNEADLTLTVDDGVHHFTYVVPARSAVSFGWK